MADPRAAALRPPSPVRTWFDHHGYSRWPAGGVFERPWAALLTMVMALSLALPLDWRWCSAALSAGRQRRAFARDHRVPAAGRRGCRAVALAGELEANATMAAVRHDAGAGAGIAARGSVAGRRDRRGRRRRPAAARAGGGARGRTGLAGWLLSCEADWCSTTRNGASA